MDCHGARKGGGIRHVHDAGKCGGKRFLPATTYRWCSSDAAGHFLQFIGGCIDKSGTRQRERACAILEKIEQEVYHTDDFTYQWMDDKVAEMYKDDERTSDIYTLFSYMAIWVSCLGLLGISLFEIRRRYREIAIRKVNGATRRDLYLLLVRRYLLVQLLAFVVAAPVAWLMIQHYTATFVEKLQSLSACS